MLQSLSHHGPWLRHQQAHARALRPVLHACPPRAPPAYKQLTQAAPPAPGAGADPTVRDRSNNTPLYMAARALSPECVHVSAAGWGVLPAVCVRARLALLGRAAEPTGPVVLLGRAAEPAGPVVLLGRAVEPAGACCAAQALLEASEEARLSVAVENDASETPMMAALMALHSMCSPAEGQSAAQTCATIASISLVMALLLQAGADANDSSMVRPHAWCTSPSCPCMCAAECSTRPASALLACLPAGSGRQAGQVQLGADGLVAARPERPDGVVAAARRGAAAGHAAGVRRAVLVVGACEPWHTLYILVI